MGTVYSQTTNQPEQCQDVERVEKLRPRPSLGPAGLDSSSPLDVFTVCSARETMLHVLVLELPSTSLPSWSTSLLRSSSWLATPPATTRRPGSSPVISSSPSGTTKS